MKSLPTMLFCGALTGCSIIPDLYRENLSKNRLERSLREFASADVSKWSNNLLIGKAFPSGRSVPVSDAQASKLQLILSHAILAPKSSPEKRMTVSPDPRLCALDLGGTTWYFMPPGDPVQFSLPPPWQKQFEDFMTKEFDLQ